jgi:hypothetical protein
MVEVLFPSLVMTQVCDISTRLRLVSLARIKNLGLNSAEQRSLFWFNYSYRDKCALLTMILTHAAFKLIPILVYYHAQLYL